MGPPWGMIIDGTPKSCTGSDFEPLAGWPGNAARGTAARALIRALAFKSIEDLDRLDNFAGVSFRPFRRRSNQELGRYTGTELLQRAAKCLLELQLSLVAMTKSFKRVCPLSKWIPRRPKYRPLNAVGVPRRPRVIRPG
jgi:hypothetical protein